jgi:acyl-coenzyme A thioesterase PaaI-like protein
VQTREDDMDRTSERIEELRRGFEAQPSVQAIGATLRSLSVGRAEVELVVSRSLLVNGDLPPGMFVQGGYLIGVLPNFAGVYAAMTLSQGHALLVDTRGAIKSSTVMGERIVAKASAVREGRTITVTWQVESADTGATKSLGTFVYRLKKSESPDREESR